MMTATTKRPTHYTVSSYDSTRAEYRTVERSTKAASLDLFRKLSRNPTASQIHIWAHYSTGQFTLVLRSKG